MMEGLVSSVRSTMKLYGVRPHVQSRVRPHVFELYPCDCLARIEALVLLTALLLVVRYVLDMFRRRSSSQILHFVLIMLATLPYALLDYTIGLMQLTKSNNDVYQVWAVVLVTLRYSIRAVRPSGIFGKQNPLQDMMSSLWTANLLGTRTTMLKIPLWLLWSLNSVRIILAFADTELTSSRHQRHLRLLAEYMRTEHRNCPLENCDAKEMKGYKYLVWGEDKQKVKSDPPEYRVRLEVTNEKKFITTTKVWARNGTLLGKPNESNELKDLCLAFALFKLLRRRFFGLPIHEANQQKTKDFALKGLFHKNNSSDQSCCHSCCHSCCFKGLIESHNYDRAFQIIEAELAFLNDFFFTRYAVMFARGFPIPRLVLSLSVIGVACYLALLFYYSRGHLAGDLSKTTNGVSVTWILLVILTMKEIWEMVTYMMSDWTKVALISNYVQEAWWTRCPVIMIVVRFLCTHKIVNRWHGIIWQYNLFQSFQYLPRSDYPLKRWIHCVLYKRLLGYRRSPRIRLSNEVKRIVSESFQYICNQPETLKNYSSTAAKSIYPNLEQKIPLMSNIATETQKILVWHVATCYCEIKLAKTSENAPKFSSLTMPFLLENLDSLEDGLESHYRAATTLSQYAAHLLTLRSPLVPDRSLVATELFRSTVQSTREYLHKCRSWEEVLQNLDKLANEKDGDVGIGDHCHDKDDTNEDDKKRIKRSLIFCRIGQRKKHTRSRSIEGKIILKMGVNLGKALLEEMETKTELWVFLEKFWAGYLLYLASAVSPAGHKQSLSRGGEFLTHLWAFLSNGGVLGKAADQKQSSAMRDLIDNSEDI
ncbi:hypothetical protein LUZ61_008924 [Rhynchospora tenuis]|uniref:DUF4220 domain-containing protein n=1 Tax=Rhynchospora tenuis TaxID=198213 RepID=A0AAD6EXY9_9POAL|nr:hypothetical protein LUZ61_008924 [Rhynchospora tenuis]